MPNVLSYECLLRQLRAESGLYLLGAGTSAGLAPLGTSFWDCAPLDFWRNLSGVSVERPIHSPLTQKIVQNLRNIATAEIFPDRKIRVGTLGFPFLETLQRMPNRFARLELMHQLAKPNFEAKQNDSYGVFGFFSPSLIANYNHDGLATRLCGHRHRILDMHGSVGRELGSPFFKASINRVREDHRPETPDGILMGVPESWRDKGLALKLLEIGRFSPAFIAIIGYSFARHANGHDDHVSLDYFEYRFSGFRGQVYIIDPEPDYLREILSERLKSRNIVCVRARWNILAHAFVRSLGEPCGGRSINYIYEHLLDAYGGGIAFPIARE